MLISYFINKTLRFLYDNCTLCNHGITLKLSCARKPMCNEEFLVDLFFVQYFRKKSQAKIG